MQFNNLPQLLDFFKDEETCKAYYEQQRWGGIVTCPFCGNQKIYRTNRGFKCANPECHKKFSVTVGTIFENSKISLRVWFAAIYLGSAHKKGISSLQLSRDLGITQKTAWFVLHRVREMLKNKSPLVLKNTVEIDETYVGGKNKNRHWDKKVKQSQGRAAKDKTPVVGLLERDGEVIAFVVKDTEARTIIPIMQVKVDKGATIVTDAYRSYAGLGKDFRHVVVKGADGKYVLDNEFHTNNIEGFWGLLKRGIFGIYHFVSEKHLQRYCDEFGYRYNTRALKDAERFDKILTHTHGRLKYQHLIGAK